MREPIWQILATVWIIGATVVWSRFFLAQPFTDEGNRLFGMGYAWMAVGSGLGLMRLVWSKKP
jgi:hypothetical protein